MRAAVKFLAIFAFIRLATTSCPSRCQCDGTSMICSSVGITDVPEQFPSKSVEILDLSSNMIVSLEKSSFIRFSRLSVLYLSYNEIEEIHVDAFAVLEQLEEIDLSNNLLEYVNPEAFSNNPRLKVVSLSGNPLAKMSSQFPILVSSSVRLLDLSLCSLQTIYPETFGKLPNLHILNLGSNNLQTLSPDTLNGLEKLRIVDLENNPWSCNSELEQLVKWANTLRNNVPAHKPLKCIEDGQRVLPVADREEDVIVLDDPYENETEFDEYLGYGITTLGMIVNWIYPNVILSWFVIFPCILGASVYTFLELVRYLLKTILSNINLKEKDRNILLTYALNALLFVICNEVYWKLTKGMTVPQMKRKVK